VYDRLLASIGERAGAIGPRPLVTHWPHVGSAYEGLVIVGQALYGSPDDFAASQFQTPEGRAETIRISRARNADRPDPLDWIATSPVCRSPFWSVARMLAEELEEEGSQADVPCAGPLREAQNPFVGELLLETVEMLDAKRVIALVGPYWWPAGSFGSLSSPAKNRGPCLGPADSMGGPGSSAGIPEAPAGADGDRGPTPT